MDKNYWKNFYKKQNENLKPSLFAQYVCSHYAVPQKTLVELGCGNGRDAVFFANERLNVTAYDQCEDEIKFLVVRYEKLQNITFRMGDFSALADSEKADIIYSRFTLHSGSKEQEQRTMAWAFRNLKNGGHYCMEARGQKNDDLPATC